MLFLLFPIYTSFCNLFSCYSFGKSLPPFVHIYECLLAHFVLSLRVGSILRGRSFLVKIYKFYFAVMGRTAKFVIHVRALQDRRGRVRVLSTPLKVFSQSLFALVEAQLHSPLGYCRRCGRHVPNVVCYRPLYLLRTLWPHCKMTYC